MAGNPTRTGSVNSVTLSLIAGYACFASDQRAVGPEGLRQEGYLASLEAFRKSVYVTVESTARVQHQVR